MAPQFSIVIPTRHRPDFVRQALHYAAMQLGDFEVVVADNWIDPDLSAQSAYESVSLRQGVYVRPSQPLGMVDNWNFALENAHGEYVLFFTDKNVLLPTTLERLAKVIAEFPAEIYNWSGDSFTPLNYDASFGPGYYGHSRPTESSGPCVYDSKGVLHAKASGSVPRALSSPVEYALGKICFGAFRRSLIEKIISRCGKLFFPISPDYTSMILGLHHAAHLVDVGWAGIVQINTLISNGQLCATDDLAAESYLKSIGIFDEMQLHGLVPGMFVSQAANVAFDYLQMSDRFDLDVPVNRQNWLVQAARDIFDSTRQWSSVDRRDSQQARLTAAMLDAGMGDPKLDKNLTGLPSVEGFARSIRSHLRAKVQRNSLLSRVAAPILSIAEMAGFRDHIRTRFHMSLARAIRGEQVQ